LAEYRDCYGEFLGTGIDVAAISADEPIRSASVARELRLPFTLLCDPGRKVMARWGLLNRNEKGGIAYPACFLVDRNRKIHFRCLEDVGRRVSAGEMAQFARAVLGGAPLAEPTPKKVRPRLMFLRAIANAIRFGVKSPSTDN
jgi:peroxiredoxin